MITIVRGVLVFLAFFVATDSANGLEDDPSTEDRLFEFFSWAANVEARYCVVGRTFSSSRPKGTELSELNSTVTLFRMSSKLEANAIRVDMRTSSVEENSYVGNYALSSSSTHLIALESMTRGSNNWVFFRDEDAIGHRVPIVCGSTLLPIKQVGAYALQSPDGKTTGKLAADFARMKIIRELTLENGNHVGFLVTENGMDLVKITFSASPKWAILSAEWFMNEGKPVNPLAMQLEDAKNWPKYARTDTQWSENSDRASFPARVTAWQIDQPDKTVKPILAEFETCFLEWKTKKEVDEALFDTSRFTKDLIRADTPFEAWKEKYERLFNSK